MYGGLNDLYSTGIIYFTYFSTISIFIYNSSYLFLFFSSRPGSINGEVDEYTTSSPPSSDGMSIDNKGDNQACSSPMIDAIPSGSLRCVSVYIVLS